MAVATESTRGVSVPALVVADVTANEVGVVAVQAERDSRDCVTRGVRSRDLEACNLEASAAETITECDAGSAVHCVLTREEEAGKARDKTRCDQLCCVTADTGCSLGDE